MQIKVAVFDDHKGQREALQMLLADTPDMVCVGAFENCLHVIEQIHSTKPDVVLMDIDMPEVNGLDGLRLIREHAPNMIILMQTVFDDEEKIFTAIRNGAHGYFLKKTPPDKLIDGIRDALEGGAPMSSSIARKVFEAFKNQPPVSRQTDRFDLTIREQEILALLMKGMSYKMIADHYKITYNTVNGHCKKIYVKLQVHSATEAVAKIMNQQV